MKKTIAFILLFFLAQNSKPADYLVAGADPDFTTMTLAIAAVGSTDTLQLAGNITEGVVWNRPCAMIWMDEGAGYTWTWAGAGMWATLEIQSGMNQAATLKGIIIDCSSGAYATIYCPTTGASEALRFERCFVKRTSTTAGPIIQIDNANQAGAFTFAQTKVSGNSSSTYGIRLNTMTSAGGVSLFSSLIYGLSTGVGLSMGQPSSNQVVIAGNLTIDGCATGYSAQCAATFTNSAFTNNTDDISLSNNASPAHFTYCAFQEQTDTGTFGAGCKFGISGSQYVDRADGNFKLSAGSTLINSGMTYTPGSPDLDGVVRPKGTSYDIGAYEYIQKKKSANPFEWWSLIYKTGA